MAQLSQEQLEVIQAMNGSQTPTAKGTYYLLLTKDGQNLGNFYAKSQAVVDALQLRFDKAKIAISIQLPDPAFAKTQEVPSF